MARPSTGYVYSGRFKHVDKAGDVVESEANHARGQSQQDRRRSPWRARPALRRSGAAVSVAVLEMEFVGSGIDALAFGRCARAVLVDNEHACSGAGNIRLMAEFGELGFDGRIGDADGGPVVKELAGRGMLGDGFERGAGIVVDGLVLNLLMSGGPEEPRLLRW